MEDSNSCSKDIYETLVNWFGNHETGEEALKANGNKYPISPSDKEHKEIRKIKLYMEYKNTGHMINNGNVEKGGIYRIDVFKSKNIDDDKLYFAAYDILEIKKINTIKKKKINIAHGMHVGIFTDGNFETTAYNANDEIYIIKIQ